MSERAKDDRALLTQLRSLVVRGDHAGLVATLSRALSPTDSLQLIGDGLLAALRDRTEGSADLAQECVNALRERGWAGDHELARVLDAVLGHGPTPMLRSLPVDLEELSMILEGDPVQGGGRIDGRTGEVWPQAAIEYAAEVGETDEDEDDEEHWLWVECEGSHAGYGDMEWFIADLDDPQCADQLVRVISGRGAFRSFTNTLSERPELLTRWSAFSSERQRGRARSWLAVQGYVPTRPQWPNSTGS